MNNTKILIAVTFSLFLVLCINLQAQNYPVISLIPGGDFQMGDHYGFVDPQHPSDEVPVHLVHIDSFYIGTFNLTNQQYCDYLNSVKTQNLIVVKNNKVYAAAGDTNAYYLTNNYSPYYSIGWNGTTFSVVDFRANHPVVGIMWYGAAAYCNWISQQLSLPPCYNITTWDCDFTKNGYRLPTEAEWEYAGRGGQNNPYYMFPWGNDSSSYSTRANWPSSGDPYESGPYPYTTPVDFYDGTLKLKSDYNWPGSATNYQTSDGKNGFGLSDMCGNVWQFVNDWYETNYYKVSPYSNPRGPIADSASAMPDGKKYKNMRGGNWWSGTDGWSRVSNRDPAYYRGPGVDWFHVGFRVARNNYTPTGIINQNNEVIKDFRLYQNYPNPFNPVTRISFTLSKEEHITLVIYNSIGQESTKLVNETLNSGTYSYNWNADNMSSGVYFCYLKTENIYKCIKMLLVK